MFLSEFNANQKRNMLIVFSGRFQPFHRGHMAVYQYLTNKFGSDNVFVATSNSQNLERSPFSFEEKKKLMMFSGIPEEKIVMTRNPYKADELTKNYDVSSTTLVFVVSKKDMEENPRFHSWKNEDGSPTYLQPYDKNRNNMLGFKDHAYIFTSPTFNFTVLNNTIKSASELRDLFVNSGINTQKYIIKDLYGKYDNSIHKLMYDKLRMLKTTEATSEK